MESSLIYLVKVSGILALFYLAYQLFLKQETFFNINRHFLITGILTAFALPLVTMTNYVEVAPALLENVVDQTSSLSNIKANDSIDWTILLFVVYLLGVLFLGINFMVQLFSLSKMIRNSHIERHGKFYHVEVGGNIAPFSFFNYIFYNSGRYSQSDLLAILEHEKAHGSQWHSVDVILSHLITIFTWMNPFSWLYQANIKQNLEFLADENAIKEISSIKSYQYTLLKVSGNQFCTAIVNHFYNSLIKKRIVMLNKSKSNKKNILKTVLILPALAIFLVSFNTNTIYIPISDALDSVPESEFFSKIIEITIDKNTTNKELEDIKKDLAQKGVDFSYSVIHNSKKEITEISIDFTSKKEDGKKMRSSSTFNNGDDPIDPIHIIYDEESNSISMGNAALVKIHEDKDIHLDIREDTDKILWVHADSDKDIHKTIEIIEENGKETIKVNGEKVSREEFDKMQQEDAIHEKHIQIKKSKKNGDSSVFIIKNSDDKSDTDIEVISKKYKDGFFFIHNDGDEKPLYIIDGKETKEKDMTKLGPSRIKSVNVLKGEMAREKYGKKGENGVVEITTKKRKID